MQKGLAVNASDGVVRGLQQTRHTARREWRTWVLLRTERTERREGKGGRQRNRREYSVLGRCITDFPADSD